MYLLDCVNLINKYDTRRFISGLLKQIPDLGSAHTHKHLHEFRTGYGEEGDMGFSRHSPCKERLAGSGRTHQQCSLWKICSYIRILLRIVKEVHDFL